MNELGLVAALALALVCIIYLSLRPKGEARLDAERRMRELLRERGRVSGAKPVPVAAPSAPSRPATSTTGTHAGWLGSSPDPTSAGELQQVLDRGQAAIDAGDLVEAARCYRAALLQKLDENSPVTRAEIFYRLGVISEHQRDTKKAIAMFERALNADPSFTDARDALRNLR